MASEQAGNKIEMRICADTAYLSVVRAAAGRVCEMVGLNDDEIGSVLLALDEALTNVIRHGYDGPCEKSILISFQGFGEADGTACRLEIVIRDYGRQVELERIKSRDLEDIRPGGLGVHIIQSVMDEVEYSHWDGGGMQLRMVKQVN